MRIEIFRDLLGNNKAEFILHNNKVSEFIASIDGKEYTNPETDLLPVLLFSYKVDPQDKFYHILFAIDDSLIEPIKEQLVENGILRDVRDI